MCCKDIPEEGSRVSSPTVTILPGNTSKESRAVLKRACQIAREAAQGRAIGLCFTLAYTDRDYETDAVGSYADHPTDAIGPVEVLALKLKRRALDGE